MFSKKYAGTVLLLILLCVQHTVSAAATDPLPSWQAGEAKNSIISFVTAVTDKSGPDYVPPGERIATFDNDGTLWSEKPVYFQLLFAIDRIKALAPQHPEWKTQQPFKAVLKQQAAREELLEAMARAEATLLPANPNHSAQVQ